MINEVLVCFLFFFWGGGGFGGGGEVVQCFFVNGSFLSNKKVKKVFKKVECNFLEYKSINGKLVKMRVRRQLKKQGKYYLSCLTR